MQYVNRSFFRVLPSKYALSFLLIAVTMALIFLARNVSLRQKINSKIQTFSMCDRFFFGDFQMDKSSRVLYLWRTEVEEQRERASDIRRRNEALVYNILPPHVATHFLGSYKRQHEELYSQSYAEVGVLFASMPNFSGDNFEDGIRNMSYAIRGLVSIKRKKNVKINNENCLKKNLKLIVKNYTKIV